MFIRPPVPAPLANSTARYALMLRSERGTRIVEIGGRAVTALIVLAALLFAWFLAATTYVALRDDMVVSMLRGERRTVHAYEERILELRTRIDRITARQLLNQDTIEDRVSGIIARQAELEARQTLVAELGSRAEENGMPMPAAPLPPAIAGAAERAPFTGALPMMPQVNRKPQPLPPRMPGSEASAGDAIPSPRSGGMGALVDEVERRSGGMEKAQVEFIERIGSMAEGEVIRAKKAVAALGLDPGRFGKAAFHVAAAKPAPRFEEFTLRDVSTPSGIGGPLLPPLASKPISPDFETAISHAEGAIDSAAKARAIFNALPIGRPMTARHELSSGFGSRLDPFTRSLAQHSGLDFRAPTGTPVKAVTSGEVITAGYNGGYGKMVEIDHGFGITTRYAHLSSISVKEGDRIAKGGVLGHVGSTGRSTGPHLHYEVRVDDDALDPMRFVRAEKLLAD
jgi:murein DD-endopeptidase MepM/ murein hydrolase activator NlpD